MRKFRILSLLTLHRCVEFFASFQYHVDMFDSLIRQSFIQRMTYKIRSLFKLPQCSCKSFIVFREIVYKYYIFAPNEKQIGLYNQTTHRKSVPLFCIYHVTTNHSLGITRLNLHLKRSFLIGTYYNSQILKNI